MDGAQLPDDGYQETNVLGTDPVELGDEVTERVGLGRRRVEVGDQHAPPHQACEEPLDALRGHGRELGHQLLGEFPDPDRRVSRAEDKPDRRRQLDGRLDRSPLTSRPVVLVGDDETAVALEGGVVDDDRQERQQLSAPF